MLALAHSLAMLFAARIVDGLSGGNITTARAYIADITTEENRAKSFGLLGAAFGLGFIVGPALGAAFSRISYTAPIWAAAAITVVATALAWFWLPETVHRAHAGGGSPWQALAELGGRESLRMLFTDRFRLLDGVCGLPDDVRAVRRAAVRLRRGAHRISVERVRLPRGARPGRAGRAGRQARSGERRTLAIGLLFAAVGWGGSALTHSLPVFVLMLVPGAIGIGLCNATLSTLISNAAGAARAGPGPGRGRRAREPRPDDRPGLGQRRAAAVRRGHGVRFGGDRAPRRGRCLRWRITSRRVRRAERHRIRRESVECSASATAHRSRIRPTSGSRRELPLQPRDQIVELLDDRADGVGLAQIDARLLQQLHRIVAAAGAQQRQVALARVAPGLPVPCMISCAMPRRRREAGRVLVDVVRRVEEVRDARPGDAGQRRSGRPRRRSSPSAACV